MSNEKGISGQRMVQRVALAAICFFLAYSVFLLTNAHLIRVSLIEVVEVSDTGWLDQPPAAVGDRFAFEDSATLVDFDPGIALPPHDAGPPSVRAMAIFASLVDQVSQTDPADACWNSESPQLIVDKLRADRCRGFCSDYAIVMATTSQKAGIPARRIVLDGPDRMGGGTHVVAELWLEDLGQWVMFDLTHFVVLRDDAGRHLSFLEARRLLLSGQRRRVTVEQLTATGTRYGPEQVLDYYTMRLPDSHYIAGSDLFTDNRRSIVRRMISRTEQSLARLGPSAMMPPRFLGRLLLTRTRYRPLDEMNPKSYSPQAWFVGYRVALGAALLGLAVLAWMRVRSRTSK